MLAIRTQMWGAEDGLLKESLSGHKGTVYHIAMYQELLLSCSLDETLKMWLWPKHLV